MGETKDGAAEGGDKGEKKSEVKEKPKNLVYQNPMDFKEKKTFKNKYEEWKFGDWKKGSGKTFVTLETVIPPVPAKLLTKPDEPTFLKKMTDIEDKIKEINASL